MKKKKQKKQKKNKKTKKRAKNRRPWRCCQMKKKKKKNFEKKTVVSARKIAVGNILVFQYVLTPERRKVTPPWELWQEKPWILRGRWYKTHVAPGFQEVFLVRATFFWQNSPTAPKKNKYKSYVHCSKNLFVHISTIPRYTMYVKNVQENTLIQIQKFVQEVFLVRATFSWQNSPTAPKKNTYKIYV